MGKFDESDMVDEYIPGLDTFELYHKSRESQNLTGPALPALGHAVSGAAGSVISNTVTYPLSLVITRLQVQKQLQAQSGRGRPGEEYKDVFDAARKIYKKEGGIKAFYSGLGPELGKTAADAFLFFLAYNFLRSSRQQTKGSKKLSVADELGLGMLAGAFAKLFTTPIQNIVTRKQTASMLSEQSSSGPSRAPSTREIYEEILHEKGVTGLWAGYSATLVLTLNPGLTFLLHNFFQRLYLKATKQDKTGARWTFAIAASSKAIASAITYPLSVAKSRSQVSRKTPAIQHASGDVSKRGNLASTERKVEQKLKQNTVFGNVLKIAHEDGLAGLYAGLGGEVFKGFVQHGLTMSMKENIFRIIVQLYYVLLKALQRYPSAEELAALAQERTEQAAQKGAEVVGKVARTVTRPMLKSSIPAGDVYGRGYGKS